MNRKQLVVMWAGLALIVGCCLYVPTERGNPRYGGTRSLLGGTGQLMGVQWEPAGRAWLWRVDTGAKFTRIDWGGRLLLPVGLVALVSVALVVTLHGRQGSKPPRPGL
jgi:hypothetical protein